MVMKVIYTKRYERLTVIAEFCECTGHLAELFWDCLYIA